MRAPTTTELTELTHTIAQRVGGFLQRQRLLECDGEQSYLAAEAVDEGTMDPLLTHSITYRIAVGPQAGRKVFALQTLPASEEPFDDPVVIKKILMHLDTQDASAEPSRLPPSRAPPQAALFDRTTAHPSLLRAAATWMGRGRVALGLMVGLLSKIAFACGQFPGLGGWDSGRYHIEGGLTAS